MPRILLNAIIDYWTGRWTVIPFCAFNVALCCIIWEVNQIEKPQPSTKNIIFATYNIKLWTSQQNITQNIYKREKNIRDPRPSLWFSLWETGSIQWGLKPSGVSISNYTVSRNSCVLAVNVCCCSSISSVCNQIITWDLRVPLLGQAMKNHL